MHTRGGQPDQLFTIPRRQRDRPLHQGGHGNSPCPTGERNLPDNSLPATGTTTKQRHSTRPGLTIAHTIANPNQQAQALVQVAEIVGLPPGLSARGPRFRGGVVADAAVAVGNPASAYRPS